jgi:hypothetical protein
MRAGLAPDTRQGILTMLTARGEFPESAQEAPAVQGSFDCETASLRGAVSSLRMTELIANRRDASGGGIAPLKPKDGLSGPPVLSQTRMSSEW